MIKQMVFAGMLLGNGLVFGQELIAHWFFSNGKIDSTDGKFKMRFRGNTRIAGPEGQQYLDVGITNKDRPEGIISVKKYPELTPKGAFRLEIKARLREQTCKSSHMVLWDTHYHLNPKNIEPNKKKGLTFYLVRSKEGKLRPYAAFGFAESLDITFGNLVELEEGKDFTLAVEYDGVKKVFFYLNGKLNRATAVKKGGQLAQAVYPLVIGDRYNSLYNRFDGQILEVKLTELPSQKK